LGSLKNLYFLDASDNAISGNIPASFRSNFHEKQQTNSLEGKMIGDSFRNLGYLQVLDLSYNRLSGSIPAFLFDTLPSLQQLVLSFNHFSSLKFPASLATKSVLSALSFENNKLTSLLRTHNVRLKSGFTRTRNLTVLEALHSCSATTTCLDPFRIV
jgi:Leucine-rich repeat (LRR) protein